MVKFVLLQLFYAFLIAKLTLTVMRVFFGYKSKSEVEIAVSTEVEKKLNELRKEAVSLDSPYYVAYVDVLDEEPICGANDKELLIHYCKMLGCTNPFIVKTTKGEFQKDIQKRLEKIMQEVLHQNHTDDDDDWDNETYGKHPDGEI